MFKPLAPTSFLGRQLQRVAMHPLADGHHEVASDGAGTQQLELNLVAI